MSESASSPFVRVQVEVLPKDASLIKRAALALSDPDPLRQLEARRLLRRNFGYVARSDDWIGYGASAGLKALLAAATLEGVDLDRNPDPGREIDLSVT